MAFLASCWIIIESVVIPDGLKKWFCLSFYIHPFFLFACQIFLWLRFLYACLSVIISFPFRVVCVMVLYIYKWFQSFVIYIFSFTRSTNFEVTEEGENLDVVPCFNHHNQTVVLNSCLTIAPTIYLPKVIEPLTDVFENETDGRDDAVLQEDEQVLCFDKDASINVNLSSPSCSNLSENYDNLNDGHLLHSSISSSTTNDLDMISSSTSDCSTNLSCLDGVVTDGQYADKFYEKYTERMRWFDVLNHERTCGISAIFHKQWSSPSSVESTGIVDFSPPNSSWSKMTGKRLLKSLESDFELVYVAQSCLSWEALHHQYRKVEALAGQNGVFYSNVAGEFQKFQVLLERFMEDQRSDGKRVWSYVRGRFSFKSLLQVPELPGFVEEEKEDEKRGACRVKDVLNAIEKCIQAFWVFVKTDNKKSWWKLRTSLWTCPIVEDPRDLALLAEITRILQKRCS
ncbi:uncharacterized protein LOC119996430 isoform X2 [Tripterygium wilfordii]|uniref:uncharacterized protein LOC119996430 isoform X2 n=1 Tax=Tripterygium wilfordii TaxID=458696 RepID=UPI0018F7ED54|nr:uncharacterized protein LOC119996430 isoform X2 [Tripterygium wilfordii]